MNIQYLDLETLIQPLRRIPEYQTKGTYAYESYYSQILL